MLSSRCIAILSLQTENWGTDLLFVCVPQLLSKSVQI